MSQYEEATEAQLDIIYGEFQDVLDSLLSDDKTLDKFRGEYERLLLAFRKGQENEKKLVRKVKDLNNEIVLNAKKVESALKLSEEDSATIEELKKQVERAWSMVEAATVREEAAKGQIERLAEDNSRLTSALQKTQQLLGADTSIEDLLTQRDTLAAKLREAEARIEEEGQRCEELTRELATKTERFKEKKSQCSELERQLAVKAAEEARDSKKRTSLEAETAHLKEQLTLRLEAIERLKKSVADAEARAEALEKQLLTSKGTMSNSLLEYQKLHANASKLASELQESAMQAALVKEDKAKLEKELRQRAEDIAKERAIAAKLQAKLDAEGRERERLIRALDEEKANNDRLRAELEIAEKGLDQEAVRAKATERVVARLDREKATAEKKITSEQSKAADALREVAVKSEEVETMETENRRLTMEAAKMRNVISVLERDRERLKQQLEDLERRLKDTQEEVAERDDNIGDLEKKAKEAAAKMKQSQSAYEALRAEKAVLAKELAQAQDDISELKRKEKVQANQIEGLKEDIHAKDRALVAEEFEHQSVEKRLEQRLHEVEQLKKLLEEASASISKQDAENLDLNSTIRRLDAEALAQKRAYDQVVTERDILGTQLIRRNDELALLYEKLAIQSATLSKGENQYKERLEDLRLLRIKILDLKRELAIAKATEGAALELKKELVRLQKQVLSEQTKVKALSEELENPMNVHRWRKLEGSDPASYEMIQKVQTLQRRLIAKTEEVVERDLLLAEKEKLYAELKAMLARQPGPEVAEALAHYQHLVVERTRQLKALTSEMNMHQTQLNEYRYEIDRLTRQLLDAKKAYYEVKTKLREYQSAGLVPLSASNSIVANTVGGGSATLGATGTGGKAVAGGSTSDAGSLAGGSSSINGSNVPTSGTKQPPQPAPRFVGGGFNVSA